MVLTFHKRIKINTCHKNNLIFLIGSLFLICSFGCYDENSNINIHKKVWKKLVTNNSSDKFLKYSIYASRILCVKHPEMYLKSDEIFLRAIQNQTLFSKKKDGTLYPVTFSLNDINLKDYHIISFRQTYPSNCHLFDFLDRRIYPLPVTLRQSVREGFMVPKKIKQIELGVLYYLKRKQFEKDNIYIIYCSNENTYVYQKNNLFSMKTLNMTSQIEGDPILIFNEFNVWYPLMNRDDTSKDKTLKEIVDKYKTKTSYPRLSKFELEVIRKLEKITELENDKQEKLAVLSSGRLSSYYGFRHNIRLNKEILDLWVYLFPNIEKERIQYLFLSHPVGMDDVILQLIVKKSNSLSPLTSYIMSKIKDKKNQFEKLVNILNKLGFDWACLWTLTMFQENIDESFFSHSGTCEVHANNITAILDLLGVKNIGIATFNGRSAHQVVYVPLEEKIFSNLYMISKKDILNFKLPPVWMVYKSNDWFVCTDKLYIGNISPSKAAEELRFLKEQFQNELRGLIVRPFGIEEVKLTDLIKALEVKNDKWNKFTLF